MCSYYGELLIAVNLLNFEESSFWIFDDGMAFNNERIWWGPGDRKRRFPHEGLDFVRFTVGKETHNVFAGFLVPAPVSGTVVNICDDFLDKTVWMSCEKQPGRLVLLAHVHPLVVPGQYVVCGDPVGIITHAMSSVPHHIHLSVLEGQWQLIKVLTWDEMHQQTHARFVDPCKSLS
jgi:hypothetical protein